MGDVLAYMAQVFVVNLIVGALMAVPLVAAAVAVAWLYLA